MQKMKNPTLFVIQPVILTGILRIEAADSYVVLEQLTDFSHVHKNIM